MTPARREGRMALVKWWAHKNGTPLLDEWFPMAGEAYVKAADVEAWLLNEITKQKFYERNHGEPQPAIQVLSELLDALRGGG